MFSAAQLAGILLIHRLQQSVADIPVHCIPEDVFGEWTFISDNAPFNQLSDCGHGAPNTVANMLNMVGDAAHEKVLGPSLREEIKVTLTNLVESKVDGDAPRLTALGPGGEKGFWTLIADEGFEVRFTNSSYAAKFEFEVLEGNQGKDGDFLDKIGKIYGRAEGHTWNEFKKPVYGCHCDRTSVGWHSRISKPGSLQWGCFYAKHLKPGSEESESPVLSRKSLRKGGGAVTAGLLAANARTDKALPDFTAIVQIDGKRKNAMRIRQNMSAQSDGPFKYATPSLLSVSKSLPDEWDWRKQPELEQSGDDLEPETDQGPCGSCYAFAAVKSLSMRFRIEIAKMRGRPTSLSLSWRSTARCSPFSEGCNGGWPLFIGRLATQVGLYQKTDTVVNPKCKADSQDDGLVAQQCGKECGINPDRHAQPVWFAKDYGYVGGFAQGLTEKALKEEIYFHGPVALEVNVASMPAFIYGNSGNPIVTFDEDEVLRDDIAFGYPTNKGEPVPNNVNASALSSVGSSVDVARFNGWQWMDHVIIGVGWGVEPPVQLGKGNSFSTPSMSALSFDARPQPFFRYWGSTFANVSANASSTVRKRYAHTPTPYWHIRNSWGEYWGKQGYSKLLRGKNAGGCEISATWIKPDLSRMPEIPEPIL